MTELYYGGDGSFESGATYDGWTWTLEKKADGTWEIVNYGFA